VVIDSVVAGTVAWYATSVYAQRGRGQGLNSWSGPRSEYTQMLETRAQILGVTTEELQKELDAGKSMGDIAKEQGLTPEEFHQKMLAAKKIHLENLVKAGALTQDQLETRVPLMEQHYADCQGNCYGIGGDIFFGEAKLCSTNSLLDRDVDAVHQQWLQSYLHDFTVNKILKLEISHLSHGLIRNRH